MAVLLLVFLPFIRGLEYAGYASTEMVALPCFGTAILGHLTPPLEPVGRWLNWCQGRIWGTCRDARTVPHVLLCHAFACRLRLSSPDSNSDGRMVRFVQAPRLGPLRRREKRRDACDGQRQKVARLCRRISSFGQGVRRCMQLHQHPGATIRAGQTLLPRSGSMSLTTTGLSCLCWPPDVPC